MLIQKLHELPLSTDYFLSIFSPKMAARAHDMVVLCSFAANGFGCVIANIRCMTDSAPNGR